MNLYRCGGLLMLHSGGITWYWWDAYTRVWETSLWVDNYPPHNATLIANNVVLK